MNGIIIYASRYGSTRQYAEWLREETGFTLCEVKRCPADLGAFDTVVLASYILAGHIALAAWIRRHWPALQGKRVYLLLTHILEDELVRAQVVPQSLPPEITAQLPIFLVGGRYVLDRMSFLHRTMIKMVASASKQPEVRQQMLTDRDEIDRDDLQPLLAELRRLRHDG